MKRIITFTVFVLLLSAQTAVAQCSRTGNFISNGSDTPTSGSATIIFQTSGVKQVTLGSNFSTSNNGPDIHVILCKTAFYNPSTDLIISGVLNQITGMQSFNVPSNVELNDFQYVLIHCVAFNHRFGYAMLGSATGQNCATLATGDFDEDLPYLKIFPNPTTDVINFSLDQKATVTVYNIAGEKLVSDYTIDHQKKSLSLESLPNGLYLIQLDINGTKHFKKIIKNK